MAAFGDHGCGTGGGAADGGNGGRDGLDGADARPDYDVPADLDLGDGFGIWVPQNTRLCSLPAWGGDLQETLAWREISNRIELVPGLVKLPRSGSLPQLDWIASMEIGPQRKQPAKAGAGTFERNIYAGTYSFKYTQRLSVKGKNIEFALGATFEQGQNLLVLDSWQLGGDLNLQTFYVRSRVEDGADLRQFVYTTCAASDLQQVVIDALLEGGASLQIDYRCPASSGFVILSTICPCLIERARYATEAEERVAENFFDVLEFSYNHCNIDQATLVFLPAPLEGCYGFFAQGGAAPMQGLEPKELLLLDKAGKPLTSKKISSWKRR